MSTALIPNRSNRWLLSLRVILSTLFAILLPPLLNHLHLPVVSNTYGTNYQIFELFGFSAGLVLLLNAAYEIQRNKPHSCEEALLVLLPLGVAFLYLILICEYSSRAWDYDCYVEAANQVIVGANPYKSCYFYPPLVAQALAAVYQAVVVIAGWFGSHPKIEAVWLTTFYLYQCMQYGLVLAAYKLNLLLARRLKFNRMTALGLVTALFVVNDALVRTLRHNQVNLWVLVLSLAAILLLESRPYWAGVVAALGGHIKLYPLILLAPWTLAKKWRALAGVVAGALLVMAIQVIGGRGLELWTQFIQFFSSFPQGTAFRDNGLHSLVYNIFRFSGIAGPPDTTTFTSLVNWTFRALTLVALAWLAWRYIQVERRFPGQEFAVQRLLAHSMDALAATLLVAPLVWEHHYIIMIPVVLWAAAVVGKQHPWQLGVAACLMLAFPTFDLFPFSFHRLAGLIWLLILTSPSKVATYEPDHSELFH